MGNNGVVEDEDDEAILSLTDDANRVAEIKRYGRGRDDEAADDASARNDVRVRVEVDIAVVSARERCWELLGVRVKSQALIGWIAVTCSFIPVLSSQGFNYLFI